MRAIYEQNAYKYSLFVQNMTHNKSSAVLIPHTDSYSKII